MNSTCIQSTEIQVSHKYLEMAHNLLLEFHYECVSFKGTDFLCFFQYIMEIPASKKGRGLSPSVV